jgi:ketosteroid isomerase-like protein
MATEQSDREVVIRAAEVLEREGLQGLDIHFDELCSPAFEWSPAMLEFGEETYVGREGYRRYLEEVVANVTDVAFRLEDVRSVGDGQVLVLGRLRLASREGGEAREGEYALAVRVEEGTLRSCTAFASHAEAEEAARA